MTADLYFFTTGTGGHYYPFASLLNLLQWLGIIIVPENSVQQQQTSSSPFSLLAPSVLVAMAAYQLHALRRWYETWNIERPSPTATINIGHYLIGITFYAAIAPALWIDAVEKIYSWNHVSVHTGVFQASGTLTRAESIQCLVGLTMFLWASWHQHRCHCILANLRAPAAAAASTEATTTSQYKVPFGDWFRYMVTPHYSAEMLIYFGLYIMVTSTTIGDGSKVSATRAPSPTLLIACVWTVINLGVVSRETDAWYKARFGPDYSGPNQSRRRILIPFVY
ncbi:Steroid 5 alpha-reductase 3 [Podila epigama]|nr:Steroid 5 alpha-reductase 3 [Podila epigama]